MMPEQAELLVQACVMSVAQDVSQEGTGDAYADHSPSGQ